MPKLNSVNMSERIVFCLSGEILPSGVSKSTSSVLATTFPESISGVPSWLISPMPVTDVPNAL